MKKLALIVPGMTLALVAFTGCGTPSHTHSGVPDVFADHVGQPAPAPEPEPAKVVEVDTDGDGIPDDLDNCPDEAGTEANQGCQAPQLVQIRSDRLVILEKVFFATGSDTIEERSYALLDNVARVLKAHPAIDSVRIEGHTDSTGDAAFNLDLSQRRAAAVKSYLTEQGVTEGSLSAKGFGPERPIESNDTNDGRAANRRVEFVIAHKGS